MWRLGFWAGCWDEATGTYTCGGNHRQSHGITPTNYASPPHTLAYSQWHHGRQIYTYDCDWVIFATAWNQREDMKDRFRIALGSFIEEYNNKVQVGACMGVCIRRCPATTAGRKM